MRLETTDYLFRIDTHIAILIAVVATLQFLRHKDCANNITQHISSETAYNMVLAAFYLAFLLLDTCAQARGASFSSSIYAFGICYHYTSFIRDLGQSIKIENQENVAIYGADTAGIQS